MINDKVHLAQKGLDMDEKADYLGDGVYVKFDGYHIVLMANNRENPTDTVALDPHVLKLFLRWLENLKASEEKRET
jgi:hypothetical protein